MSQIDTATTLLNSIESFNHYIKYWDDHLKEQPINNEIWKSIAEKYFDNEIKHFNDSKFISNIDLFPEVTLGIINNFLAGREGIFNDYELVVEMFSTMLPKHYLNYPHLIEYKNDSKKENFETKLLLYFEQFVSDYNDKIKEIVNLSNSNKYIKISRYTILTWGNDVYKNLNSINKIYSSNNVFSLQNFLSDCRLSQQPRRIKLNSFKNGPNYSKIAEYSCGLTDEELGNYYNEINNAAALAEAKAIPLDVTDNISCSVMSDFIYNLHSKDGAYIVLITNSPEDPPDLNDDSELLKKIIDSGTPVLIDFNKLDKIFPDFIVFNLKSNTNNTKIFLAAEIDLSANLTKLIIMTQGHPKYSTYEEKYELLKANSLKLSTKAFYVDWNNYLANKLERISKNKTTDSSKLKNKAKDCLEKFDKILKKKRGLAENEICKNLFHNRESISQITSDVKFIEYLEKEFNNYGD